MPRPDYLLCIPLTALENEVAAKIDGALAGTLLRRAATKTRRKAEDARETPKPQRKPFTG
ncbi:TPA: hypothetical protein ACOEL6_004693 [Enterobacter cloacae]